MTPANYYDARADGDEEQVAMHAKCVVVDDSATFITSANFTSAAQTNNVEVGVLVGDTEFAQRVGAQWRSLAARGLFTVRNVRCTRSCTTDRVELANQRVAPALSVMCSLHLAGHEPRERSDIALRARGFECPEIFVTVVDSDDGPRIAALRE